MKHRLSIFIYLFLLIPSQAISLDYQKISTRYFDFFFNKYDKNVVEPLASESDIIAEKVMSNLGVIFKGKIEVRIAGRDEFKKVQPHHRDIPNWVSGIAYHTLSLIILRSPRPMRGGHYDLKKTFVHELTHVLFGSSFKNGARIPRWLNEGVSMYESREWNFSRVSAITQAVLTGALLPLSEITYTFPRERREVELAYCQSFYLISYLIKKYGKRRFQNFIKLYIKEGLFEDALLKIYGVNLNVLEKNWHRSLKMRYSWIPIITSTSTLWFIITLIFICGYIRKRRRVVATLQQWEEDELP